MAKRKRKNRKPKRSQHDAHDEFEFGLESDVPNDDEFARRSTAAETDDEVGHNREENQTDPDWNATDDVPEDDASDRLRQSPASDLSSDDSRHTQAQKIAAHDASVDSSKTQENGESRPASASKPRKSISNRTSTSPRRVWRRRLLGGLATLLVVIYFAPAILAWTPALSMVLNWATQEVNATATIGRARLGWFRPIKLQAIEIIDEEGDELLRVESVETENSLWQLLCNPYELGDIRLLRPYARIVTRVDGSNWEDAFGAWLKPTSRSTTNASPEGRFLIEGAKLEVASARHPTTLLEHLDVTATLPSSVTEPFTLEVGPTLPADSAEHADAALQLVLRLPLHTSSEAPLQLEGQLKGLPLPLFGPLALRMGQTLSITGTMNGNFRVTGSCLTELESIETALHTGPIRIATSAWGPESLELPSAELTVVAKQDDHELDLHQARVQCSAGEIQAEGRLARDLFDTTQRSLIKQLLQQQIKLEGFVDIAAITEQFPQALHLRDDVEFKSGRIQVRLANQSTGNASSQWTGTLQASDLAAIQAGRTIELRSPVELDFVVDVHPAHIDAKQVTARSTFLSLNATGNAQRGQLKFLADGSRLQRELGQFIDLSLAELSGRINGGFRWSANGEQWNLDGSLAGKSIVLTRPSGKALLREPSVDLQFSVDGRVAQYELTELLGGTADLQLGKDRLRIELSAPVQQPNFETTWPLQAQLIGDVSAWVTRLAGVTDAEIPPARGNLDLNISLDVNPSHVSFRRSRLVVEQLVMPWGQRTIQEAKLVANADGTYDLHSGQLALRVARVNTSQSFAVEATELMWPIVPSKQPTQLTLRANLSEVWQQMYGDTPNVPSGKWEAQTQLVPQGDRSFGLMTEGQITNFRWQTRTGQQQLTTQWNEPEIKFAARGNWHAKDQVLDLGQATINSQAVAIEVAGTVRQPSQQLQLDLSGESRVDLTLLTERFRYLLGPQVRLTGTSKEPFRVTGAVFPIGSSHASAGESRRAIRTPSPADSSSTVQTKLVSQSRPSSVAGAESTNALQAGFGVGWQAAHAWGFDAGPTQVRAEYSPLGLVIAPIQMPVSGGQVVLRPSLTFGSSPRLMLARGQIVQNVEIRPEMCQQWFKYVAPLLAESTSAQGRFSVEIAGAELPLASPQHLSTAGAIQIHGARVGPGPLAKQVLGIAQQVRSVVRPGRGTSELLSADRTWVDLPAQKVGFRVEQGRVAHQNLTMVMGDLEVRTRGWVTLDQQLNLVAEIPIREDWVDNERWLAGLRGKTLQIPIRGNLNSPQVDRRALQSLAQQTVRGAAEGLIQDELKRQLQKLIP